ncbi:hypothetical protein E0Z10_g5893 [Xylaria hypoxylon]|uniref:DUF7708 domain-containing protein n=1 Tax=Xylaria hypoxylon TaxID=37992 RepID=A0A4Z0YUS0_9PEZI|nr:hypothetical protein E0Z10_g5893 [Xylaria hypoxylon]
MAANKQDGTTRLGSGTEPCIVTPDWITHAYAGDELNADKPFEPAQVAFKNALEIFKQRLTNDPAKKTVASDLFTNSTLGDVLNTVQAAKRRYESASGASKLREGLVAFSQRLLYYGNIMDVLIQHHPEYVSLAWGAMKFIFGAVVEHERTATTIVNALCDISDSLPSVELSLALYPTSVMKHLVSMLYAHIMRFLIRALKYYEESSLMRVVHSITRPATLRYDDLLGLIRRDEEMVRKHAITSSQAEIRAVNNSILALGTQLQTQVREARAERQIVQTQLAAIGDWMTQIRVSLSEVQVKQALSMVSSQCAIDHKSAFQSAAQMCNAPFFRQRPGYNSASFWTSPKLKTWNQAQASSTILLKSTFNQRAQIRSFCTEVVEQLLKDNVAVFWIFMSREQEYPLLETLRSLVYQALSLNYVSYSESSMGFQLQRYMEAHFEEDYLNILGDLLQHLKRVYIIANSEAMSHSTAVQCRAYLQRLSQLLSERGCHTVLKIITTSYSSATAEERLMEDIVLSITTRKGHGNQRKARKQIRRRQEHMVPTKQRLT